MPGGVAFTSNYSDLSNDTGYQFEFRCDRCGNGYKSNYRHSVLGFGGRLLNFGGSLFGGVLGSRVQQAGWGANSVRDWQGQGTTKDRRLVEAIADVRPNFEQCHRCGQWVCKDICWNPQRGLCCTCAPKLDQEIAGMQADAQRQQLADHIRSQNYLGGVHVHPNAVARCRYCNADTGGGAFCQSCGAPLARERRYCRNCGNQLNGSGVFCTGCGANVL